MIFAQLNTFLKEVISKDFYLFPTFNLSHGDLYSDYCITLGVEQKKHPLEIFNSLIKTLDQLYDVEYRYENGYINFKSNSSDWVLTPESGLNLFNSNGKNLIVLCIKNLSYFRFIPKIIYTGIGSQKNS